MRSLALVTLLPTAILAVGCGPRGGAAAPASADPTAPLFNGLGGPKLIAASDLTTLFGTPELLSVPAFPDAFAPAGAGGADGAGGAGVGGAGGGLPSQSDTTNFANLTIQGAVPADFVTFIKKELAAAIEGWDRISGLDDFKLTDALHARKLKVVVTTDVALFKGGRWFVASDCPAGVTCAQIAACTPRMMILYDAAQWEASDPWLGGAAHHEMFHVGHHELYRQLGKLGAWYCAKGVSWQHEGFATFGGRQMSDGITYQYPSIVSEPFFKWSSITDQTYDRSYETAAFIDRMAGFARNPQLPFAWIRASVETESQALTWLRVASGGSAAGASNVDVAPFEVLYLRAALDTIFPGVLGGGTDPVAFVTPKVSPQATVTLDARQFPQKVMAAVPVLSSRLIAIALGTLPSDGSEVALKLASDDANASYRGLLVGARAALPGCYAAIGVRSASAAAEIQKCFGDNARMLGAFRSDEVNGVIKLKSADLQSFAGGSLALLVVRLFDGTQTLQPAIPANFTLTIDKAGAADDGACSDTMSVSATITLDSGSTTVTSDHGHGYPYTDSSGTSTNIGTLAGDPLNLGAAFNGNAIHGPGSYAIGTTGAAPGYIFFDSGDIKDEWQTFGQYSNVSFTSTDGTLTIEKWTTAVGQCVSGSFTAHVSGTQKTKDPQGNFVQKTRTGDVTGTFAIKLQAY